MNSRYNHSDNFDDDFDDFDDNFDGGFDDDIGSFDDDFNDNFDDNLDDFDDGFNDDFESNQKSGLFAGLIKSPADPRKRYADEDKETALFAPGRKPAIDGKGRHNPELLQEKVPGLPQNYRTRYRQRNKKPAKRWIKPALTVASLFLCFTLIVGFLISQAMLFQIDTSGAAVLVNDIQLTDEQRAELEAAKDDGEEEIAEEWKPPEAAVRSDKDIELILVLGSDGRGKKGEIPRTDSIKLVAVDKKHKKLKIVSIQRDLYCKIPGYKDWKLNSCFYYDMANKNADLKVTKKTLLTYLRIEVDRFIIVDFTGFQKLVDIVGGIDVDVSADEAHYMCSHKDYGKFPEYKRGAGTYHMNGSAALNYARMRKVKGQNDFDRNDRQNVVISKLLGKAKKQSVPQLGELGMAALELIKTDMSRAELLGYIADAPAILGYDTVNYTVPVNGSWIFGTDETGHSVTRTNFNFNAQELHKFIFDDDMTYTDPTVKAEGVSIPKIPTAAKEIEASE